MKLRSCLGSTLAAILLTAVAVQPNAAAATRRPNASSTARPRTEPSITVVAQLPPKSDAELALEARDRAERLAADQNAASTNRWLIRIGIFQAVIFSLQLIAFVVQAMKLNETAKLARAQADDMRHSIEHAARGATAMESVAQAMTENTENTTQLLGLQRLVFSRQLRAYLVPQLLAYVAQATEQNNRLEIRVLIKNGGSTPAHAIRAVFHIEIMPVPLPGDIDLGLPQAAAPAVETYGFLVAQDTFYMRAWLQNFLSDDEIAEIKAQQTRALYAYGVVHYRDVFDEEHTAHFCKAVGWDSAGTVLWQSIPGRNDAT
jgi:hypothetical protein